MVRYFFQFLCLLLPLAWPLCASTCSNGDVKADHVFLVIEENQNFSNAFGSAHMPYLTSLAAAYAYAENYYANTHPSIGNYFMLTTGQVLTNNDGYTSTVTIDNLARHLNAAGLKWREYSESIPSLGYTGAPNTEGDYARHHNPFSYFSDVRDALASARQNELVSVGSSNTGVADQLRADIEEHSLPAFGLIVPNNDDDAHDCPDTGLCTPTHAADSWLSAHIGPLLESPDFNGTSGTGLLIVVFDESANDNIYGGGHVLWVAAGPQVKRGYKSATLYQHQSTLRFIMDSLCLPNPPGAAATASGMQEFVVEK